MVDELSTIFCMIQLGTLFQVVLHAIITMMDLCGPVYSVAVVWSVAAVWSVRVVLLFLEWDMTYKTHPNFSNVRVV